MNRVRRSRAVVLPVLAGGVLAAAAAGVGATGPAFWTVATAAEFLRGTSDGVYVSLDGVVTAGPALAPRLTSTPPQVWSLAAGADGALWAGTGGDGRLVRLRAGQPEETVFDADETAVFAIAAAGPRVYFATSPGGRVYAIDGTAAPRPFFDPEEPYIWALAVDRAGRLWVGAGNPAVIYRVDASGTGEAVYRPPASHVVCLALDAEGRVLAGTESPGRLYRLGADGRPFVLLDSGLAELRAVTAGADGVLFAAAVSRAEGAGGEGERASVAEVSAPDPPAGAPPPAAGGGRRSVVYRIDAGGAWEAVWDTPDVIYDLAPATDGGVLAASGPDGRLYRLERSREVRLFTGVDARQITRLLADGAGGIAAFATANPGRVVAPGAAPQSPATYTSPVRDTRTGAVWGTLRWAAAGPVALYTRSGNTERPDDSWSDWAGPYTRADGEAVTSPPARFVQWRAVLTTAAQAPAPRLSSVTLAYLPRNTRPLVSAVTIHPPGVVFQRPFGGEDGAIAGLDDVTAEARRPPGDARAAGAAPLGRRMYQKGLQTIAWKAEDADGDRLSYTLFVRRDGDAAWRELRAELTETIFVWDTTSVADGRYLVRVVASDAPANAADRALAGERDSDPVDVDNTPPAITAEVARQGAAVRLVVRVRDAQTAVQKLEYSLGGGRWQVVYPVDGLADSPEERFEIPLAAEADAARVVLRATDQLQNVASLAVAGR